LHNLKQRVIVGFLEKLIQHFRDEFFVGLPRIHFHDRRYYASPCSASGAFLQRPTVNAGAGRTRNQPLLALFLSTPSKANCRLASITLSLSGSAITKPAT